MPVGEDMLFLPSIPHEDWEVREMRGYAMRRGHRRRLLKPTFVGRNAFKRKAGGQRDVLRCSMCKPGRYHGPGGAKALKKLSSSNSRGQRALWSEVLHEARNSEKTYNRHEDDGCIAPHQEVRGLLLERARRSSVPLSVADVALVKVVAQPVEAAFSIPDAPQKAGCSCCSGSLRRRKHERRLKSEAEPWPDLVDVAEYVEAVYDQPSPVPEEKQDETDESSWVMLISQLMLPWVGYQ